MTKARIAVIGDVIVDETIPVRPVKMAQEAPILAFTQTGAATRSFGGAGAVHQMLEALGCEAALYASRRDQNVTLKRRFVTGGDSRNPAIVFRLDEDVIAAPPTRTECGQLMRDLKEFDPDMVILSDYGKGAVFDGLAEFIGDNLDATIAADPYSADWRKYRGADILLPSRAAAAEFLEDYDLRGFSAVVVKLDRDGCEIHGAGDPVRIPSSARFVFDVTGAGDQFAATFAAHRHLPIREAVTMASIAAGIQVERAGIVPVTAHELEYRAEAIFGPAEYK